jgi:hypothetical protein
MKIPGSLNKKLYSLQQPDLPVSDGIPFGYINCKIIYNANRASSGSVPVDTSRYYDGTDIQVKDNIGNLVRTGFNFAGWNSKPDGSGSEYTPYQINDSNVIVYATWINEESTSFVKRYGIPGGIGGLGIASGVV